MTRFTYLPDDGLHILERNAAVVGLDDQFEEIVTQHFEHHAHIYRGERNVNGGIGIMRKFHLRSPLMP